MTLDLTAGNPNKAPLTDERFTARPGAETESDVYYEPARYVPGGSLSTYLGQWHCRHRPHCLDELACDAYHRAFLARVDALARKGAAQYAAARDRAADVARRQWEGINAWRLDHGLEPINDRLRPEDALRAEKLRRWRTE